MSRPPPGSRPSTARSCEQCGRPAAPDDSFCHSCGGYLGWHDPVGGATTAEPPASGRVTAPQPVGPSGPGTGEPPEQRTRDELHVPSPAADRHGVALSALPDVVAVDPGGEATTEVRVRNTGSVVDEFQVRVEGVTGAWVESEPPTVAVYPGQEVPVVLVFRPPRDVRVAAGTTPFRVVASSVRHERTSAEQAGRLDLAAVSGIDVDATRRLVATDSADFHVVLHNRGNAGVRVSLRPGGAHYEMEVGFDPPELRLPPFGVATSRLHVAAPDKDPVGSRAYPMQVQALVDDDGHDVVGATAEVVFVHEPGAPPRWYVATLVGWLLGGLVLGAVVFLVALAALVGIDVADGDGGALPAGGTGEVGEVGEIAEPVQSGPSFDVEPQVPTALAAGAAGFVVGGTWGAFRALRSREAVRRGLTGLLVAVGTLLWVAAVGLAGVAQAFAAVLVLVLLNPAVLARWLALRGLPPPPPRHSSAPELVAARGGPPRAPTPPDRPRTTAPLPSRPAPSSRPVGRRPEAPGGAAAPTVPPTVPRPAGRPEVEAHGAVDRRDEREHPRPTRGSGGRGGVPSRRAVLLAAGPAAALLLYLSVGLPGTLTNDVNLRATPDTSRAPVTQIRAGTAAVTVRCVVDENFVAVSLPRPGYVTTSVLRRLPTRPCLP